MKRLRPVAFPVLALVAACASYPQAGVAPGGAPMTVVEAGQAQGCTAVLAIAAGPKPYALQQAVHRWVAADVHSYDLELKVRNADGVTFSPVGAGLTSTVSAANANGGAKAVFANLSQGKVYRVYVTARGNVGGTAATTLLTSTPATADFDFSAAQDVMATVDQSVTVVLDGVPFNGTGTLTFTPPSDGTYVNPAGAPTITYSTPTPAPTPTPLDAGTIIGHVATGANPQGVAVDANGVGWIGTYQQPELKAIGPDGTTVGTFAAPHNTSGVGIAPDGHVWVTHPGNGSVSKYTGAGGLVGTYGVDGFPYHVAFDGAGNVLVSCEDGTIVKLAGDGTRQATFTAQAGVRELLVDPSGNIWCSVPGADKVLKLSSAGALLATATTGGYPRGLARDSAGNIWSANANGQNLSKIAPDGTVQATYPLGGQPAGLAIGDADHLWVGMQAGSIKRVSPAGAVLDTFPTGQAGLGTLVHDAARNRVWVVNYSSNTVTIMAD